MKGDEDGDEIEEIRADGHVVHVRTVVDLGRPVRVALGVFFDVVELVRGKLDHRSREELGKLRLLELAH